MSDITRAAIHGGVMAAGLSLSAFARWMEWVGLASVGMTLALIAFISLTNLLADT